MSSDDLCAEKCTHCRQLSLKLDFESACHIFKQRNLYKSKCDFRIKGVVGTPSRSFFTNRSKAVFLLWIFFVFVFLSLFYSLVFGWVGA